MTYPVPGAYMGTKDSTTVYVNTSSWLFSPQYAQSVFFSTLRIGGISQPVAVQVAMMHELAAHQMRLSGFIDQDDPPGFNTYNTLKVLGACF
jgi:hypothetical protein